MAATVAGLTLCGSDAAWSARIPLKIVDTAAAPIDAGSPRPPDEPGSASDRAREAVREAVIAQLDRLSEGILDHETSRPRTRLLQRRMTVETFLIAGLAPQQLLFGRTPDLAAPWRFDFDGTPSPLVAASPSAASWAPPSESGTGGADVAGLTGRFQISFDRSVGGDDPPTIGGRLLVRPDRAMLAATWCEPCLAPDAIDFPILPEGFLLEWDDSWRTVRVRLPRPDRHAERTMSKRDAPPRLDQPGDLYDLFDGLRPLPWLLGGEPGGRPSPRVADSTTPSSERSAPGVDDGVDAGGLEWVARATDGRLLQRVTMRTSDGSGAEFVVEQPPVDTRWTSSERYELVGDVLGVPVPTRTVRPEGVIVAHEGGSRMTLSVSLPASASPSASAADHPDLVAATVLPSGAVAEAVIDAGGRRIATIRWDRLRRLGPLDADRLEASFRHAFAPPPPGAAIDPFVAFDPGAAGRRELRDELRAAIEDGPDGKVRDRLDMHLERLAADGLSPILAVRSIEALEERLLGRALGDSTAVRLELAWREAVRRCEVRDLHRLLHDRVRQGRFGAARRLATTIAGDPSPAGDPAAKRCDPMTDEPITNDTPTQRAVDDADRPSNRRVRDATASPTNLRSAPPAPDDAAALAARLERLLREGPRPVPPWYEPPGRHRLALRLAGGAEVSSPRSAAPPPRLGVSQASPPLERLLHDLLDEAIADSGVRPRQGARHRLHSIIDRRIEAVTEGVAEATWSDAEDRRRLAEAMGIFLAERRHLLAAHLRSRGEGTGGATAQGTGPGKDLHTEFERHFDACIDRILRLGPADESLRVAGDREENALLAAILDAAVRLGRTHRCSPDAAEGLRSRLVAISDGRRLRRASPCFPALLRPLVDAAAWHGSSPTIPIAIPDAVERAVAEDSMLATIAERISIEERLISADPSTATFRNAMRTAQIDALATRLDGVVLDAVRGAGSQLADAAPIASAVGGIAEDADIANAREHPTGGSPQEDRAAGRGTPPHVGAAQPAEGTHGHERHPGRTDTERFEAVTRWVLEGGAMPQ